jgi:CHAT domain-containing protein
VSCSPDPRLDDLLTVAERSYEALRAHIESLPPAVGRELAELAADYGQEVAHNADRMAEAPLILRVAGLLCLHSGEMAAAINCNLIACEVDKVLAEEPEAYEAVRLSCESLGELARNIAQPKLVFDALATAADAAYFQAGAYQQRGERDSYHTVLRQALAACVRAVEFVEAATALRLRVFVSLIAQTVVEAMGALGWFEGHDEVEVRGQLRTLALAIETYVPNDFSISGDPAISAESAARLARLSYEYGSPDHGRGRLLASRTDDDTDSMAPLERLCAQYALERTAQRSADQLHALRRDAWFAIDCARDAALSRAARVHTAQRLDALLSEMILDEFRLLVGRDVDDCFTALEANKSRILLDELDGNTVTVDDAATAKGLLAKESQLLHLAAQGAGTGWGEQSLVSRLPIGGLDSSPDKIDVQGINELDEVYRRHRAGFVGSAGISTLPEIMDSLQPGEGLLHLHIPYDPLDPAGDLVILLITCEGALPIHRALPDRLTPDDDLRAMRMQVDGKQPVDVSPVGQAITLARLAIREGHDDEAASYLRPLYDILLGPLADYGRTPDTFSRLIIVPHGPLHAVPFAALQAEDGRFVAQMVAHTVAPSASVWHRLRTRPAATVSSFAGFADPRLGSRWAALPDARREVTEIAGLLSALAVQTHTGAEATETRFRELAPAQSILHLATHGEFPQEDAIDLHRALLTPADGHDGRLHAEEVRGMDLWGTALATLSICDGGLARFGPGDEQFGLISAFLAAGARNVLGPLWEVDDVRTARLMVEFYRHLLDLGPAGALQKASTAFMMAGEQIRDWAGFAVFGDGQPFSAVGSGSDHRRLAAEMRV